MPMPVHLYLDLHESVNPLELLLPICHSDLLAFVLRLVMPRVRDHDIPLCMVRNSGPDRLYS